MAQVTSDQAGSAGVREWEEEAASWCDGGCRPGPQKKLDFAAFSLED